MISSSGGTVPVPPFLLTPPAGRDYSPYHGLPA